MSDTNTETRYPNCEVELLGTSSNAVAIIMRVQKALRRYLREQENLSPEQIEAIIQEFEGDATSSDYDNVLTTCFRWVDVS